MSVSEAKIEKKCYVCGSNKTYRQKNGAEYWRHDVSGNTVCHKCWCKQYKERAKSSPKIYDSDFKWAKTQLRKIAKRKSDIIKELASRLESKGMKLELICTQIVAQLASDVDDKYVYKVLPAKYKRPDKRHGVTTNSLLVGKATKREQPQDDLSSLDKNQLLEIIRTQQSEIEALDELSNNLQHNIAKSVQEQTFQLNWDLRLNEKTLAQTLEYAKINKVIPVVVNVDAVHKHVYVHVNDELVKAPAAVLVS